MRRVIRTACAVGIAIGGVLGVASPAAHAADGQQTFTIRLVVHSTIDGRNVLASPVRADGVFTGAGYLVEQPNLPGDPDSVNRDDLVFRAGTLSLLNTFVSFDATMDPRTCIAHLVIAQTSEVVGGTGVFSNATGSFTDLFTGQALAGRAADGSCSQVGPLREVDRIRLTGTLNL